MSLNYEDAVRALAHQKWIEEGYPEGRDKEHWKQAEAELSNVLDSSISKIAAKKSSKSTK